MISHLKGTVEKVAENTLVMDVNGVGYKLICSARTFSNISALRGSGTPVHIFTELVVREDSWTLYGFISESERLWFGKLTSVQGVGGKAAMAVLSALSDDEIYNAFLNGDSSAFTRAEGVGPKLASRIVSELKDKIVGKMDLSKLAPTAASQGSFIDNSGSGVVDNVISALVNLGYQKSDIYRIMSSMKIADDVVFDDLLKQVLRKVSSGG